MTPNADDLVGTLVDGFDSEIKRAGILDPDIIFCAKDDARPVGRSLALPDANLALAAAHSRKFPFGIIKMLLLCERECRRGARRAGRHPHRGHPAPCRWRSRPGWMAARAEAADLTVLDQATFFRPLTRQMAARPVT